MGVWVSGRLGFSGIDFRDLGFTTEFEASGVKVYRDVVFSMSENHDLSHCWGANGHWSLAQGLKRQYVGTCLKLCSVMQEPGLRNCWH